MKRQCIFVLSFFIICATSFSSLWGQDQGKLSQFTSTQKSIRMFELYKEGRQLEKQGLYEKAMIKYKAMIDPSLLNFDYDAGMGRGSIMNVYIKQGQFEQALQELQWFLERNPKKYEDGRLELLALIKSRDAYFPKPIYEYIDYLKGKYKNQLPPKVGAYSDIIATIIIRLYDYIGDADQGIQFVDGFLRFYAKRGPGNPYQPANPYFQIKQAFEQDKAEGFKGCFDAKPGDACMGRATKALIQSNYFSW